MTKTIEARIKLLKEMTEYIRLHVDDEEIYMHWVTLGPPDEADDMDYETIAEDNAEWVYTCKLFATCVGLDND